MTTNVYDGVSQVLATDSRWSYPVSNYAVMYVDDTGFEKIVSADGLAFMFAGSAETITLWKDWIKSPARMVMNRPVVDRIAICMVDAQTGEVVFDRGQSIVKENARFAGTGAFSAHTCWNENGCAIKAVETAKSADIFSGGGVKFYEAKTNNNNLPENDSHDLMVECFEQRGRVMLLQQQNANDLPLGVAASNDEGVKNAVQDILSGKVHLTAPCPSIENEWTEAEEASLDKALGKYFK